MTFLEKLLNYYSISEEEHAREASFSSLSFLPDISGCDEVQKAIARLRLAKDKKERVLIYGDYDCDGIMATSITKMALSRFGIAADTYIPSRYLDGYGINAKAVERVASDCDLIFTVDNGVAALDAIQAAAEKHIDIIVLDHHSYETAPEPVVALVHPRTVGLDNPSVSAGFLSYLFSHALLGDRDPYFAVLGAMSLISDAMELESYNRLAVRLALRLLNRIRYSAISLLTEATFIDEKVLGMEIIPKINAVGRVETTSKINVLIKYFCEDDPVFRAEISEYLFAVNSERKTLTREAAERFPTCEEAAAVVVSDLPEGLNGLLASRLLDQFDRPVAVLSPDSKSEGVLVGSLRSREGFSITDFFATLPFTPLAGGGHAYAGGISIRAEDFDAFKSAFIAFAENHPLQKETVEAIPIALSDITMENYKILRSFGPFGQGHRAPIFALTVNASALRYSYDGKRLQTPLGQNARLFSFRFGRGSLPEMGTVTLLVEFNLHEWREKFTLSADVVDAK